MLFEEGGDHVNLNFIDVNQIKKNRVSAAQFGKQRPIASTLRNSQSKYSITDEKQKVNDKFYFPLFYDTVCADVIEKLETLIKEKRREALGNHVVEDRALNSDADVMREVVVSRIEQYVEDHEITEQTTACEGVFESCKGVKSLFLRQKPREHLVCAFFLFCIFYLKVNKRGKVYWRVSKTENITQDIRDSYGKKPTVTFLRDASIDNISQKGQNSQEKT